MIDDVRAWFFYPIPMPVTADGCGPVEVGEGAARMTYEVWDRLLNSHGSFEFLPDAINAAMELNKERLNAMAELSGYERRVLAGIASGEAQKDPSAAFWACCEALYGRGLIKSGALTDRGRAIFEGTEDMRTYRCKCGAVEIQQVEPVQDCQGCEECGTRIGERSHGQWFPLADHAYKAQRQEGGYIPPSVCLSCGAKGPPLDHPDDVKQAEA